MAIRWIPDGSLDLKEPTKHPHEKDEFGGILAQSLQRCKNIRLDRKGAVETRWGSVVDPSAEYPITGVPEFLIADNTTTYILSDTGSNITGGAMAGDSQCCSVVNNTRGYKFTGGTPPYTWALSGTTGVTLLSTETFIPWTNLTYASVVVGGTLTITDTASDSLSVAVGVTLDDDDFTVLDSGVWSSAGSPSIVGGELQCVVGGGVTTSGITSRCDWEGDFIASVDYENTHGIGGAAEWAPVLRVQFVSGRDNSLNVYHNARLNKYYSVTRINGIDVESTNIAGSTTGKFRVTRVGAGWQGWYWNGSAFATLGSLAAIGADDVRVKIAALSWNTKPSGTCLFDNFTIV